MSDQIEIIRHPYIKFLNIFIVELTYRSPHFHHDFELLLILSGNATLLYQGKTYSLQPEDIILLNPNETHELHTTTEGLTTLCMQFSPKFFENTMPSLKFLSFDALHLSHVLSKGQLHTIRCLFMETCYQYMKRSVNWQLISSSLLGLLVSTLLKYVPWHTYSEEEVYASDLRRKRVEYIIKYVEDNYANKILLSDIAKKQGISTGYLSHFIRDNLNQSFQEYVTSVRFRHAIRLLNSNKSLIDICLETGFSNTRYLTKAFLKYQGVTPKEYIMSAQKPTETKENNRTTEYMYSHGETLSLLEQRRIPFEDVIIDIL